MVAATLVVRRSRSPCRGLYTNERAGRHLAARSRRVLADLSQLSRLMGRARLRRGKRRLGPGANRLVVDAIATAALPG